MIIFLNGKFKKINASEFDAYLPENLPGVGAFETMRMYQGKIFAFDEHVKRLDRGLNHYHLKCPLSQRRMLSIIKKLSSKTKLKNARVRLVVWKSKEKNVAVSMVRLNLPSSKKYKSGVNVMTYKVSYRRKRDSHIKTNNYREFREAFTQANKKGFDEALLFNVKGYLIEGSRSNVFFFKNGVLYTPAIECGALNGITRMKVIECARHLGIKARKVKVSLSRFLKADEAFLTGSTLEIMPIRSVDGHRFKSARKKYTQDFLRTYRQMVNSELGLVNYS